MDWYCFWLGVCDSCDRDVSFWTNKDHRTILDDAEDLSGQPEPSPWTRWLAGCLVAGVLAAYAGYAWFRGWITLPGRGGTMVISGRDVGTVATAYLALAAFLHFHCFWSLSPRLRRFAKPLKAAALLVLAAAAVMLVGREVWSWVSMAR